VAHRPPFLIFSGKLLQSRSRGELPCFQSALLLITPLHFDARDQPIQPAARQAL